MSLKKQFKTARGFIMRGLTRNIGAAHPNGPITPVDRADVKRVLISRPNHRLGNQLLITPLIQEVNKLFPQARIDLFVKGHLGPTLFKQYKAVDRVIQLPRKPFKAFGSYLNVWIKLRSKRYDIAINVVQASSSGRLSVKFADARFKFFGDVSETVRTVYPEDHQHMAKYPVYSFRENLKYLGIEAPAARVAPIDLKLTAAELQQGKTALAGIIPHSGAVICLFTFATDTKRYNEHFWTDFYTRIREAYPHHAIFEMLPAENVSALSFSIPHYYSQDIRLIGSIFANCSIFIGADSGMMHLAAASQVPTVGLFKVTDMKGYEPYGKDSTGIDTKTSTPEAWMQAIDKILNKTAEPASTAL